MTTSTKTRPTSRPTAPQPFDPVSASFPDLTDAAMGPIRELINADGFVSRPAGVDDSAWRDVILGLRDHAARLDEWRAAIIRERSALPDWVRKCRGHIQSSEQAEFLRLTNAGQIVSRARAIVTVALDGLLTLIPPALGNRRASLGAAEVSLRGLTLADLPDDLAKTLGAALETTREQIQQIDAAIPARTWDELAALVE